jgi:hypothetical protein
MLRRVAVVRTDVSEELSASFITVKRIGEVGTMLALNTYYAHEGLQQFNGPCAAVIIEVHKLARML